MAKEEVQKTEEEIKNQETAAEAAVEKAGAEAGQKAEAQGASPEEVQATVEKARKEEKDKLYPQIEDLKKSLREVQDILKAEQDDKKKIKKDAEERAERERLSSLTDQQRLQETLNRLEEQLRNETNERERFERDIEERDRKDNLRRYRDRLIEAHSDEIIPEIVQGDSVEELDESLEKAKARFKELEERLEAKRGQSVRSGMPRPTNPDIEALEELELSRDLTQLDTDKYLADPDYRARIQSQIENEYAKAAGRR